MAFEVTRLPENLPDIPAILQVTEYKSPPRIAWHNVVLVIMIMLPYSNLTAVLTCHWLFLLQEVDLYSAHLHATCTCVFMWPTHAKLVICRWAFFDATSQAFNPLSSQTVLLKPWYCLERYVPLLLAHTHDALPCACSMSCLPAC